MSSDSDGLAEHTRDFAAGEMAFRRGVRPDDGASASFLAGWQSQALQSGADLQKVKPLALHLGLIEAGLEAGEFLSHHAVSKVFGKAGEIEAAKAKARNALKVFREAQAEMQAAKAERAAAPPPTPSKAPAGKIVARAATRKRRPTRASKARA